MKNRHLKLNGLVKLISLGFLSTYSVLACATLENQSMNLDKHTKKFVASNTDCVVAAKDCLLQVEPTTTSKGSRAYNVAQICETSIAQNRYLYELTLTDQVAERKFLGTKFCSGVVTISDMNLPFSKNQSELDANDGRLLIETAETGVNEVLMRLQQMSRIATHVADGTYSSTQYVDLNTEFMSLEAEVNRVANTTTFNDKNLLDSHSSIDIRSKNLVVFIQLADLTTGESGLNLGYANVETPENAKAALSVLSTAVRDTRFALDSFERSKERLPQIAEEEEVVTSVDLRQDIFVVKQGGHVAS